MNIKRFLLGILCVGLVFLSTGCFKKSVITTSKFLGVASKNNLTTSDVLSQYSSYNEVKEATVARSDDGWQLEFYVLDSEDSAVNMFTTNKNSFEEGISGGSSKSYTSAVNYSTYSLTSGDKYMHICRVDNTFLYVDVDKNYKDTVNKIIDELGY